MEARVYVFDNDIFHRQAAGLLGEVSEIGMEVFGFHDLHDFQDFLAPAGLHEKQSSVKVFWGGRVVHGGCATVD